VRTTDLLDRDFPVRIGERDFILRRITLRAVLKIMTRFAEELDAFARSDKQDVEGLIGGLDNDSTADLFAFLLHPYDPVRIRAAWNIQTATELTVLVASLNDLRRIWDSLSFGKQTPEVAPGADAPEAEDSADTPDQIPALLSVIDVVAERYKLDPMSILDWPYEAFLTITEVMAAKMTGVKREQTRQLMLSLGLSPELADLPGVEYSPVPSDLTKEH